MFESCAHGVGSIAFSGGFSEPLFDGDGKPLAFAGRAEAVPVQEGGLEFGAEFLDVVHLPPPFKSNLYFEASSINLNRCRICSIQLEDLMWILLDY